MSDISIHVPAPQASDYNDILSTAVCHFKLTPSIAPGVDWKTSIRNKSKEYEECDSLSITFDTSHEDLTALDREQGIILVVDIDNSEDDGAIWHFHQDGVVFTSPICANECQITTEVINQGTQLIMEISKVEKTGSNFLNIEFVYNAIRFSKNSPSEPKVYYSQDPRVSVGRPISPQ